MNWTAAFESEITGDTYITNGPNWADGIPEEAVDAIDMAIEYTERATEMERNQITDDYICVSYDTGDDYSPLMFDTVD